MKWHPDLVNRCEVIPGISDHDVPLFDISTRVILNITSPRKVDQYHKADFDKTDDSLTSLAKTSMQITQNENS